MLVLSRRENDRIVFPALGISVEVMKIGRTRASIGVRAPEGIRVLRHELAGEEEHWPSSDDLMETVRQRIATQFADQVAAATEKLQSAQDELAAGNTEHALATLGQTLADLTLSCPQTKSDCVDSKESASEKSSGPLAMRMRNVTNKAETVAEPSAGYTTSVVADDRATKNHTARNHTARENWYSIPLRRRGFDVDFAVNPMATLPELRPHKKPSVATAIVRRRL